MTQEKIPLDEPEKLIRHIERVAGKAKRSKLQVSTLNNVDYSLGCIAHFLSCTKPQALLFSVILALNFKNRTVGINDLADFMNCNPLTVARYIQDIEILESKRLIHRERDGRKKRAMLHDINFFITREVLDSIYKEDKSCMKNMDGLTMADLLIEVDELMDDRENGRLSYEEMQEDIAMILDQCSHLEFVKRLKGQSLPDDEQALILHLCFETMNGNAEVDLENACDKVFGEHNLKFFVKRGLVKGKFRIMKNNLVKLEDGYFRTDRNILLTDKGLETFFAEDMDVIVRKEENISNLTRPDTIPDKKLFFNDSENKELEFLTGTLKDTNFHRVRERLKKSSMMTGFTVLFYGVPGTGKTESVYQLARSTGRGILRVNISETKDMWYGESEKRVKEIFDSYRKICRKSEQIPILLFNEADGILGKRRELSHSGVAQTENAIQNILLQEMEEFEGILIATTNLTVNLDKAFERRFLYKIKFNNPGFEAKVKIWKSKIPRLHVDRAKMLAQEYNLTGGQIENVARKFTTEEIMTGNRPGLDRIREFCKEEKLDRGEKRRIGY